MQNSEHKDIFCTTLICIERMFYFISVFGKTQKEMADYLNSDLYSTAS